MGSRLAYLDVTLGEPMMLRRQKQEFLRRVKISEVVVPWDPEPQASSLQFGMGVREKDNARIIRGV